MISGLASHLWQSTFFVAAAWVAALALRANRAEVRYWIWFAASTKFLFPFSLLVSLGALAPHPTAAPALRTQWNSAVQELSQPFIFPDLADHAEPAAAGDARRDYFQATAWAVWACGFAAVIACWSFRWRRVHVLRRSARFIELSTVRETPVPVMTVDDPIEPGVFGVFRPVLLIPACIAKQLSEAQLDAILLHELCHVRRRDNLTAAIHMAVQSVFWFHPLTWWIGARLVEERERACDEEVLRRGCEPSVYADSILSVCKLYLASAHALVSGVTGSDLKRRIESIMRNRGEARLNVWKKIALGGGGIAALFVPVAIGILDAPAGLSQGQSAATGRPAFEVASLKPSAGCENVPRRGNLSPSPGRLEIPCTTLAGMLQMAYGTFSDGATINSQLLHVEGAPAWAQSEHYSLSAKAEGPTRTEMLAGPMLRTLLEERFRLRTHREMRERPVYAMTVGKGGLKVQPLADGACAPLDLTHPPAPPNPGDPLPNFCGVMRMGRTEKGESTLEVRGSTMTQFAQRLSGRTDRTVVDKTGVAGMFNFHLEFTPDMGVPGQVAPGQRGGDPSNATAPDNPALSDPGLSLFVALEEQIGLKLSSDRGAVSFLIVDHVDKPLPN